ncbi:hydrolase [Clostridia bacterium]|nr:hydrolase [Clostridia bacterium]
MKISDKISMIEINLDGFVMCPVLIRDGQDLALVDAAFPDAFDALERGVEESGYKLNQVTHVILTHQDWDHAGNIGKLRGRIPGLIVVAHELEKPHITGEKPARLPPEYYCAVDKTIKHGDKLFGATVLHIPGHTDGHICLALDGVLIAGDALNAANGELAPPNPEYTDDMPQACKSLNRVLEYGDITTVLTYHGGRVTSNIKEALSKIANA